MKIQKKYTTLQTVDNSTFHKYLNDLCNNGWKIIHSNSFAHTEYNYNINNDNAHQDFVMWTALLVREEKCL